MSQLTIISTGKGFDSYYTRDGDKASFHLPPWPPRLPANMGKIYQFRKAP